MKFINLFPFSILIYDLLCYFTVNKRVKLIHQTCSDLYNYSRVKLDRKRDREMGLEMIRSKIPL